MRKNQNRLDFKKSPAPDQSPSQLPPDAAADLDAHCRYLEINLNRRPSTVVAYRRHIAEFLRYAHARDISHRLVVPETINQWIRELFVEKKNRSGQTRGSKLAAVRGFYERLSWLRLVERDPCDGLRSPKMRPKTPRKFADSDLKALMAVPNLEGEKGRRDLALIVVLYATGVRLAELCALNVGDVAYPSKAEAHFLIFGKGAKERTVSLRGSRVVGIVRNITLDRPERAPLFLSCSRACLGERLSARGLPHILHDLKARAKITGAINPHRFRATYATNLYDEGADIYEIAARLGHEDINTTKKYIAVSKRALTAGALSAHRLNKLLPGNADG